LKGQESYTKNYLLTLHHTTKLEEGSLDASNNQKNGNFDSQTSGNPLDLKSVQNNDAGWLNMKFCFSHMLMTSL
jgi:hypothetical protein